MARLWSKIKGFFSKAKELWQAHAGVATIAQTSVGLVMTVFAVISFIETGSLVLAALMILWCITATSLQLYSGFITHKQGRSDVQPATTPVGDSPQRSVRTLRSDSALGMQWINSKRNSFRQRFISGSGHGSMA